MKKLAPVILFVYNRPEHTLKTLTALSENEWANESVLYIFADGPKINASAQNLKLIEETRRLIKSKKWCGEVNIIERKENFGLANSVISGVSEIITKHGKAIILEDDLVSSNCFLRYMNEALEAFENNSDVACISGYTYPIKNLPELFFIKGADCWGWATWKRAWDHFEPDGNKLLQTLKSKSLTNEFDFNSSYPYIKMLEEQIEGKNNSWAVRWYASAFLKNQLCLYPGKSYVNNIGADGSGTHFSTATKQFETALNTHPISTYKITIEENAFARGKFEDYFNTLKPQQGDLTSMIKSIFKSVLPNSFISFIRSKK